MRTSNVVHAIALTVALIVTAGIAARLGSADRAVPGRRPRGPARSLGQAAARAPGRARHGRRHARARVRRGARPREPVEHRVPARRHDARHRAHGPAAGDSQRRAGSPARGRHAQGCRRRRVGPSRRGARLHGRRAPPAVRREPAGVSQLHEATRPDAPNRHRRRRARPLGRQGRGRHEGHHRAGRGHRRRRAAGVRARRDALPDHDRQHAAGSEHPGRQGAAVQGRRHHPDGQPVRGEAESQARGVHARASQLAGPGDEPEHGRDLAERERPQRRRRDQHPEAGRQLRLAGRELRPHLSRARGRPTGSGARGSSTRSSTGRRRSPCRA